MYRPFFWGFVNRGGGGGKSTLAAVVCSMLCYDCGVRLVALDCDGVQGSLLHQRKEDEALLFDEDAEFYRRLTTWHDRLMVRWYPVRPVFVPCALQVAEHYAERESHLMPDLAVFELPPTLEDPGVRDLVLQMDFLLLPLDPSTAGWDRSRRALDLLRAWVPPDRVIAVWNRYALPRPDLDSWLASTSADLVARGYTQPRCVDLGPNLDDALRGKRLFGPFLSTLMSPAYGGPAGFGLDDLLRAIIAQLHLPVRIGREMLKELW